MACPIESLIGRRGRLDAVEIGAEVREDGLEHRGGQAAGLGVVARAVVAVEDGEAAEVVAGAVGEGVMGEAAVEGADERLVGDAAEAEDGAEARKRGEAGGEEGAAGGDLGRRRLVLRRDAADGVGDER